MVGLTEGGLRVFIDVILLSYHKGCASDLIGLELVVFALSLFIIHVDELVAGIFIKFLVLLILRHQVLEVWIGVSAFYCCAHLAMS